MSSIGKACLEITNSIRSFRLNRSHSSSSGAGGGSQGEPSPTNSPVAKDNPSASPYKVASSVTSSITRAFKSATSRVNKSLDRSNGHSAAGGSPAASPHGPTRLCLLPPALRAKPRPHPLEDDVFLAQFFWYVSPLDRCALAQVCRRWKSVLYANGRFWSRLRPVISYRQLSINDLSCISSSSSNCCNANGSVDTRGRSGYYINGGSLTANITIITDDGREKRDAEERKRRVNDVIADVQAREFDSIVLFAPSDDDVSEFVDGASTLCRQRIVTLCVRCANVTDAGLETLLEAMTGVTTLELTGCNELTDGGMWSCLSARLISLTISDCLNVSDDTVGAVTQLLPALLEFNLQAYHVTDAALAFFSARQAHGLAVLRLCSCWELTNHGLVNLVHALPNLTTLSLSGCSKITDDGLELVAENLKKLRSLDISWCPRVTDAALEFIACDLASLEELCLDRCSHVTDIGIGYLSTMTSLNRLFLRWCTQIRDFGLQHLYAMRNLKVLSLAGCHLLTSSGLLGLVHLWALDELELTNCAAATDDVCDYLCENMPRCVVIK